MQKNIFNWDFRQRFAAGAALGLIAFAIITLIQAYTDAPQRPITAVDQINTQPVSRAYAQTQKPTTKEHSGQAADAPAIAAIPKLLELHYAEFIDGKRTRIDWEFEWQELAKSDWCLALSLLKCSRLEEGGDPFRFRAFVAGLPQDVSAGEVIALAKNKLPKMELAELAKLLLPRTLSLGPDGVASYIAQNSQNLEASSLAISLAKASTQASDPFKFISDIYTKVTSSSELAGGEGCASFALKLLCARQNLKESEVTDRLSFVTGLPNPVLRNELSEDIAYHNSATAAKYLANASDSKLAGTAMAFWSRTDAISAGEWLVANKSSARNADVLIAGYAAAISDTDSGAADEWLRVGGDAAKIHFPRLQSVLATRIKSVLVDTNSKNKN